MRRWLQTLQACRQLLKARLRDKYGWQSEFVAQCEQLGGVYIKFLQMLASHDSTRHYVLSAKNDMIYEQVAYEPIDLQCQLKSMRQHFSYVADAPFAAGSYGQVYHARLQNEQPVIIKVLRPSIQKNLRHDLRLLHALARLIGLFTKSTAIDVLAITEEFLRTTAAETDYIREANNGEQLRSYYSKRASLVIPHSYVQLGSRHVLVQEYVPGLSLAAAMAEQRQGRNIEEVVQQITGSNIWQQLDLLGRESLNAILYSEYQMVDPHPGNIRLLSDNRVALIDFGMVSRAPRNRAAFVTMIGEMAKVYEGNFEPGKFTMAMVAFLDVQLYDALKIVASEHSSDYLKPLEAFVADYVRAQAGDSLLEHYLTDKRMARMFDQVINQGNKLGIRIVGDNVMLQRSMSMFLSIVRAIGEGHDGQIHYELLHTIMRRVYDGALAHGFDHQPAPQMSDEQAYEVTANWLTMVAEKDRRLYSLLMNRSFA